MKNYTTPTKVETLKLNDQTVTIHRTTKIGTKKVLFFAKNSDDKRIGSTLFARLYDAKGIGRAYLRQKAAAV